MDFSRAQVDPRRNVLGVGFVVLFHAALVYALMSGLARKVVDVVRAPIDTKVIEEIVKPPPPPEVAVQPPPKLDAPPPPFIPPPEVQVPAPAQPSITATVAEPPPSAVIAPVAPVAAPPAPAPAAPSVGVSCPGYKQVLLDAGYPREATRAQIDQGEVLVSFAIGTDGQVKNAAIVRSTHRAFNRHSLETVAQFRCTAQPHELAGVLVPLVFSTR